MNTGVVSRRFAKALLAYAKGEGLEDKVYKEVKTLAAHFAEVPLCGVPWKIRCWREARIWGCFARLRVERT